MMQIHFEDEGSSGSGSSVANDRRVIAQGRFIRLVYEEGWEFAERPNVSGVVVVLAITDDDEIILTEQYRPPLKKRVIDLPAGLAGDIPGHEHEALAEAARRELLEETGYEAEQMLYLAHGPSSAGLTSEQVTYFRATGLTRVGPGGGDESEDIQIHVVPLATLNSWVAAKRTENIEVDLKLYSGLYFAGHQFGGASRE